METNPSDIQSTQDLKIKGLQVPDFISSRKTAENQHKKEEEEVMLDTQPEGTIRGKRKYKKMKTTAEQEPETFSAQSFLVILVIEMLENCKE